MEEVLLDRYFLRRVWPSGSVLYKFLLFYKRFPPAYIVERSIRFIILGLRKDETILVNYEILNGN
jgi:hypothetical protein